MLTLPTQYWFNFWSVTLAVFHNKHANVGLMLDQQNDWSWANNGIVDLKVTEILLALVARYWPNRQNYVGTKSWSKWRLIWASIDKVDIKVIESLVAQTSPNEQNVTGRSQHPTSAQQNGRWANISLLPGTSVNLLHIYWIHCPLRRNDSTHHHLSPLCSLHSTLCTHSTYWTHCTTCTYCKTQCATSHLCVVICHVYLRGVSCLVFLCLYYTHSVENIFWYNFLQFYFIL